MPNTHFLSSPRLLLGLTFFLAIGAIGGAWFSELGLGMVPCKLCLWQRWPYYIALPLMVLGLAQMRSKKPAWLKPLLLILGVIFVISAGLGLYHAGVEWKFWLGPSDCGGRVSTGAVSLDDFRASLSKAKVVLCNEAAARVLGLSFAGWNAVVSLVIAALSLRAASKI